MTIFKTFTTPGNNTHVLNYDGTGKKNIFNITWKYDGNDLVIMDENYKEIQRFKEERKEVKPVVVYTITGKECKPVVVYTITGKDIHYKNMCKNSIETLLKYGNYNGDIVILTDKHHDWRDFNYPKLLINRCLDESKHAVIHRCFIPDYINLDNYTHLFYVDSDILFMNDVSLLFNDNESIIYVEETHRYIDDGFNKFNTQFMTEQEKQQWKYKNVINAGQIVVPRKLYKQFFKVWQEILGTHNCFGPDQAAFNLLIRKNLIPCTLLDKSLIKWGGDQIDKIAIINHFNTRHRGDTYKSIIKKLL